MPENTSSPDTAAEITPAVVRHLSELAKIQLDEHEIERLTADLSQIVSNIAKVSEVATSDVPATSHPIPLSNVFRPDVVGDNVLTAEQALSGAPERHDNLFVVSAILGEEQ